MNNSEAEMEDAFWIGSYGRGGGDFEHLPFGVAVSDGASESMLARRWATRLAEAFGQERRAARTTQGFLAAYHNAVSGWDEVVANYVLERNGRCAPIQWYEEPGLSKGAYATIIAVDFYERRSGKAANWRAAAVGDSCLFQIRDEALIRAFPLERSEAFSYRPPLLSSRLIDDAIVTRHIKALRGDWISGDAFYVMTDALAAWFLKGVEAHKRPWAPLRDLGTDAAEADFAGFVEDLRCQKAIHDDDTTLVRIDLH